MGVSLVLLPLRLGAEREWAFATTVLPVEDDRTLFEAIMALPSEDAPQRFWTCFERNDDPEESMAATTEDAYGTPLRMVCMCHLLSIPESEWDRTGGRTIAAWHYLQAIDSEQYVVLYWDEP